MLNRWRLINWISKTTLAIHGTWYLFVFPWKHEHERLVRTERNGLPIEL